MPQPATDGETYEEAARKGHEALLNLMATATHEGVALPEPRVRVA